MKIVEKKIVELIESEYNPRQLSKKQYKEIKDSITKFGFVEPLVVNKNKDRKNIIIGGHQRLNIAKKLGYTEVPVYELDLDLEKEKELNIRLNKNTGSFDYDMLANLFEKEFLMQIGFNENELGMYQDEFEQEFYSYDDSNAEKPIVPKFSEKYDCLIIVSDNVIDTTFLETTLNIESSKSYKNQHTGKGMVINVDKFREQWMKSR